MNSTARAKPLIDPARTQELSCSMCGKPAAELRYLMAGAAGGHICDACTLAAMKIVVRQRISDAFGRGQSK
jgi:hypothetical protein